MTRLKPPAVLIKLVAKNCDFTYVGETGRSVATCLKKHRTEVEKITKKIHTRTTRLSSISDQHKSAIADHVASTNHKIDWEDPKFFTGKATNSHAGL